MPFDRMVRAVDQWAQQRGRDDVFAQIGPTDWRPKHIRWTHSLPPHEFLETCRQASALVAHAGTGSILTAWQLGKPILVMPRRADLRETRNDHQIATARRFAELGGVAVAEDESQMPEKLDQLETFAGKQVVGPYASDALIQALRQFIDHA